jgi:hypothetical protein
MSRIALLLAAAALVAAAAGYAVAAGRPWHPRHGPRTFSITGHVEDLAPGEWTTLHVKVRNPWSRTIRVTSISARVDPSGRICPVANVRIGRFRGSVVVPPRSSRFFALAAGMRIAAPPACAGATFPLRFSGMAVVR